ncbi:unnamed protein product [Enterobius vermicularis]|uniref:Probable arginine--tRNA ligase, mitochondrial n=1 Tax=Enterobius vermicularis TaxID=51028 RepID=A0A0N4VA41_ENTVE|nr:unnamed protein product [Enterobius vermicularis]
MQNGMLRSENLIGELLLPRIESKKKILIDYSSPNIAKQFHIGNFRSTLIGRFIDSVNRAAGYQVISFNYLGDWGTQFAILTAFWPDHKPSDEVWSRCSDLEKLKLLTEAYVEANKLRRANEEFRIKAEKTLLRMEEQLLKRNLNHEHLKFWSEVRTISLNHLEDFYRKLGVRYDVISGESEEVKLAGEIVENLISDGAVKKTADGLTVITVPSLSGYVIVKKSDGSTIYFTRDLASILHRDEIYGADTYYYVVDRSQTRHFEFLKGVLKLMGKEELAEKVEHIPFGRVIGLSTRNGRTEAVTEIIDHGLSLAKEYILKSKTVKVTPEEADETARNLAISTVVVNDLKRHRTSEYNFSFDGAFKMNQTNGLLLQMKHSRLCSLENHNGHLMQDVLSDWNYELELNPETLRLIDLLRNFEDELFGSFVLLEPCKVTSHLIKLANAVGPAMARLRVSDEPIDKAIPRLSLFAAVRKVLHEGMKLLGLEPSEKM